MSMIQQTNRLPLALVISALVNGIVLMGLSLLLDPPAVRQQPPAQRLSLNTVLAPLDNAQPIQPEATETPSPDVTEPLRPDSEQNPAAEDNTAPQESPVMATANNADNTTSNETESAIEVEPADVQDAPGNQSSQLPLEPETGAESERQTSNGSAELASLRDEPEMNETEPVADLDAIVQSENRDVLTDQEPTQSPSEDMSPGATPNTENLPLAQIERQPELEYPAMAKRRRQQGQVVLRAWLNEQGELEQLSILTSSGHPLLDESALEQIRSWTFRSLADGIPHRWVQIPVDFRLR